MLSEMTTFWKHWSQLAGPNLCVRSKKEKLVGDVVWLSDQNALRGQVMFFRVISTNPDSKGIMRDVNIRIFPFSNVAVTRSTREARASHPPWASRTGRSRLPSFRDVRRLFVLLFAEEHLQMIRRSKRGLQNVPLKLLIYPVVPWEDQVGGVRSNMILIIYLKKDINKNICQLIKQIRTWRNNRKLTHKQINW